MADGLLEAVRGLWLADPELGPKPLLARLREQQPDLGAATKEVRAAVLALKAESEAAKSAAAASSSSSHPQTSRGSKLEADPTEAAAPTRVHRCVPCCRANTWKRLQPMMAVTDEQGKTLWKNECCFAPEGKTEINKAWRSHRDSPSQCTVKALDATARMAADLAAAGTRGYSYGTMADGTDDLTHVIVKESALDHLKQPLNTLNLGRLWQKVCPQVEPLTMRARARRSTHPCAPPRMPPSDRTHLVDHARARTAAHTPMCPTTHAFPRSSTTRASSTCRRWCCPC